MRILVVEDDTELARELTLQLERADHRVRTVSTLAAARRACADTAPEVVILDRVLPDGEGLEFISYLRARWPDSAVIVLSALAETEARVGGLNAGADDYLGKPYAETELLARIAALVRRREPAANELHCGPLALHRFARTAYLGTRRLRLNQRDFQLLEYFMLHAGEVLTRTMILRDVWGYDFDPSTNVIDVHVWTLRTTLAECGGGVTIVTERGTGYRLIDEADA